MNWDPYLLIRRNALESIGELRLTRYEDELAPELAKYEEFFQGVVSYIQEQVGRSQDESMIYESMKDFYRETEIEKAIHFSNYNDYRKPSIFVLENIILESLRLLANIIQLHETGKRTFAEGFQRRWIESYNDRIMGLVLNFSQNLPCAEGYVSSLQSIKMELERGPPEEAEPAVIASVRMNRNDFTSNGDFRRAVNSRAGLKDFQLIGLSIHAFRKALCGDIDNCKKGAAGEEPGVLAAFNLDNYKIFLDVIEFYGNERYGTQSIPDFETLEALFEAYDISFPSPELWGNPPHCCQDTLNAELRGVEGGRRKTKRYKRNKKKTRKGKSKRP
jgi:hypothetical protein